MTDSRDPDVLALEEADREELRRSASDLSDLPDAVVADVRRRHDRAHDLAQRIANGTVDPLSA